MWAGKLKERKTRKYILQRDLWEASGGVVDKVLCYKPEGRWFEIQWGE
jgi:hypothetical protein